MIVRELVTRLTFDLDEAKLRRADEAMGNLRDNAQKLSKNFGEMSRSLRNFGFGLTAFVTAPIALLGKSIVVAASDAEETIQKFNVVFGSLRKEADKTADTFAKDFGLASSSSRELLGNTGDLLTGFGFTAEKALELSLSVQQLGGDLASFQNIQGGAAVAGFKLTKGILGETENLKSLGIVVQQGTKIFKARTKAIIEQQGVTEQQAKVMNILEQTFIQSKNAIGDFARTSDGAANQFKIFSERLKNLREELGVLLLPATVKITGALIKLVDFVSDLPKPIKTALLILAGGAAILCPILLIIGL